MTNQNSTLTAVNIRYLLVIRELDTEDKGVRGSDIVALLAETSSAQCMSVRRNETSGTPMKAGDKSET
ncbi:hypothetical protein OBV_37900 [Oscillibacter valericigenes Sjm18-20]|nr:hypothetical protein OBV_37900 [Oscillibacter valericigenes Sjm18-20]